MGRERHGGRRWPPLRTRVNSSDGDPMAHADLRQYATITERGLGPDVSRRADPRHDAHRRAGVCVMAIVKLRPTPKSAFNPGRLASKLLLAQLQHLEHVLGLPPRTW